ncbi:MAG: ATP-binding protein [Bacteroidota bacterium]
MKFDKGRLFLSKKAFAEINEPDRQRVILTGLGASIVIAVCLFFIILELSLGHLDFIPFYGVMIVFSMVCMILLRKGKLDVAKIIFIVPVLLMIAILASIEKQATGVYLYFLAAGVYIVTIFGYEKIKYSVIFFLFTVFLAFVSYFYTIEPFQPLVLSQRYIDTSYVLNFTVSLFSSLLAIYFLMRLNIKSNEHLIKTSKELKESESKFQLAIQGSSAGIWEWDGKSDRIHVSSKITQLFGYKVGELSDLTLQGMLNILHPEDLTEAKKMLLDHFKYRTPFAVECRARTKKGNYIWVLDTGQAEWDSTGRAVRMVGTILNIDERKRAEGQIKKQNELLEKANQELDRFVYSTSHDLKAPLSSVQGLISIAELTQDPEERQKIFGLMKGRISNLNAFIADITNYSRNSRLGITIEKVNLLDLVTDVLQDLEHFENRNRVEIEIIVPEELEIDTDKNRLKVILSNLINNAIKYHNYDSNNPKIEVKASQKGDVDVIEIVDNGLGIASEHHQHLFDMFYRATEKSDGSGLGLYIVKETVDKLSGSITLNSEVGAGSAFTLSLPKLNPSNYTAA